MKINWNLHNIINLILFTIYIFSFIVILLFIMKENAFNCSLITLVIAIIIFVIEINSNIEKRMRTKRISIFTNEEMIKDFG